LLVFDCEANGISYNMLLAEGGEGNDSNTLYQELTAATSSELVGVVPTNTLLSIKTDSFTLYISIMLILLAVIFLFAVVGILDNLFQSYQSRKEEFALYATAGMSRCTVRRMKTLEICISMGFAVLLSLVIAAVSTLLLQYTLYTLVDFFKSIGKML
jgi:ABC-type antimicrobial peptide transport system permease subunit